MLYLKLLPEGGQIAVLVFPSLALVVAVHGSGVGCPGIAVDHPPAFPAEELSGKGETHVLLEGASDVGEGLPPFPPSLIRSPSLDVSASR